MKLTYGSVPELYITPLFYKQPERVNMGEEESLCWWYPSHPASGSGTVGQALIVHPGRSLCTYTIEINTRGDAGESPYQSM